MGEEINKIESEKTAQIDRSKETTQKTNQKGEEYTDTNDQEIVGDWKHNEDKAGEKASKNSKVE